MPWSMAPDFGRAKLSTSPRSTAARSIVFYVHDPGSGFRWESIQHAAVANPEGDLTHHIGVRDEKGMRPGGFGILIAKGVVNELIYSEVGNEVLMIKYTA